MNKKRIISIIAIIIVLAFIVGSMIIPLLSINAKAQDPITALQNQYNTLQKQQQIIVGQIKANKNSQADTKTTKEAIDNNVAIVQQQIAVLSQQINTLSGQIKEKEQELVSAQKNIDTNYQLFKNRLRAMYINGNQSFIEVLLSSTSINDFLMKTEVLADISIHDNELLTKLKADKQTVEDAKKAIENDKAKVMASQSNMTNKKDYLKVQSAESAALLNQLNAQQTSLNKQNNLIQKEMDDADKQIQELRSKGAYVGGELAWPLQGTKTTITSSFNYRSDPFTHTSRFHVGIDITKLGGGTYGYPISAANDGTIIEAKHDSGGYGNHLVIDHGGNMLTLYGHCSSFAAGIAANTKVKKGQIIAYVGSTGRSTGAHLHFSVILNGVYVNPLNYTYGNENCNNSNYYSHVSSYYKVKP
jgi:murein DD-endopeptidase MepM/ murein hydrolase activator NlpD